MSLKHKKHKKYSLIENEFQKLSDSIRQWNLEPKSIRNLPSIQKLIDLTTDKKKLTDRRVPPIIIIISLLFIAFFLSGFDVRQGFTRFWFWRKGIDNWDDKYCTISMPGSIHNALIPRFDCNLCANLDNVSKVSNLTPEEFTERFAYSGVPVVITDATSNWTATEVFSFEFFKKIYHEDSPALDNYEESCQFFPYKTKFRTLREVLNMSKQRANLESDSEPWYIGWSNCDPSVANILRQHYQRPYFLPKESEGTKLDWIFMGSPDYGAHMHIDHVGNPSWQAQIKGSKKWILEPPPECYTSCKVLEVVIEPGQIIVLDTNQWYHQTLIVGKQISITIGSEYD